MSFSGKVVLVTGASSGIGATTAVLFAGEGARVGLVARNEIKLSNVAQQCSAHGNPALIVKADISNEEEARTYSQENSKPFWPTRYSCQQCRNYEIGSVADPDTLKIFDEIMITNVRSIVQLTSLAVPHIVAGKGNIVNVSSVISVLVGENYAAYAVPKACVNHLTRCVALELAPQGFRVNSVIPGPVKTDIDENTGIQVTDESSNQVQAMTALGRGSNPEEIVDVIAFLASEKAKSITGSI